MRFEFTSIELRHSFEAAYAGSAHGNHPAAARLASSYSLHQLGRDLHPFAVQLQLREIFRFNRPKRA